MAALQPIAPAAIADRSAAAPSALVIPTCLRCSKRIAVSSNDEFCHFDKGPAAKCSYCRKQKKVCLPIPPRFVPDVNLLYQTHAFWCLTPDNSQEDEDASEVVIRRCNRYVKAVEAFLRKEVKQGGTHKPQSAEELTLLLVSKLSRIGDLMERIVDSYRFVNNLPALDVAAAAPTAPLIAALNSDEEGEFMAPVIHPRAVRAVADALQGVQAPPGPPGGNQGLNMVAGSLGRRHASASSSRTGPAVFTTAQQGLRKGSAKLKRSVIVDPNESEESAPEEDDVSDQPHQTTGAPRHPLDESVPALLFGSLGRKNAPPATPRRSRSDKLATRSAISLSASKSSQLASRNTPTPRSHPVGSLKSRKRAPSTVQQVYIGESDSQADSPQRLRSENSDVERVSKRQRVAAGFPTGARPVSEIRENEEEGVGDQDEISGGVRLIRSGSRVPGDMPAI
ncbi:hypothetical protein H4I95_06410 [Botrytis cinerea]